MFNKKINENSQLFDLIKIKAKDRNVISYIDEFQIKMNEQHQAIELMKKYFKNDNKQIKTIIEEQILRIDINR